MKHLGSLLFCLLIAFNTAAFAETKPKYGPEATPLALSHQYFRSHDAPDFWLLSPYYTAQQDERSCSLASVTMLVNAARALQNLGAEDELATQPTVLKKTNNSDWQRDLGPGGHGVMLDELGKFTEQALKAYGVTPKSVEVIHAVKGSHEFRKKLHELLVQNEKSGRNFILANFVQGVYTGDTPAGHIAPVGAYDAEKKRVLILDPDRQWYEPYWVSEETFLQGMATQDSTASKTRGLIWIQLDSKMPSNSSSD